MSDPDMAGEALDRLIAERLMGWHDEWTLEDDGSDKRTASRVRCWFTRHGDRRHYASDDHGPRFRPSSNIAHAWEVVETMRAAGWRFETTMTPDVADGVVAWFYRAACEGRCVAGTVELAICRAALAARDT